MEGSAPHAPRHAVGPTQTPAIYGSKRSFNPLLHFVKPEVDLISSENLRFSASEGPLGGPPKSPSELVLEFRRRVRGNPEGSP